MENDLKSTTLSLLDYCRSNDWAGYEPYDALNSRIIKAIPLLDSQLPRLALTQILKRSPINVRSLLQIPKTQNPKALGLFLSALVNLDRTGLVDGRRDIEYLVQRIIALRSPSSKYWCWGYNFPWQGRTLLVKIWEPNLVCTMFVANGLLDVYEHNHDESLLEMALSSAEYILNDLYWSTDDSCGFAYPLPYTRGHVHNANLLASALLCRIYKITGQEKFLEPALRATRLTVKHQQPNGRWDYGVHPTQKWVDNFHTGFNLDALRSIGRSLGTTEFEGHVELGLRFYREHFFLKDGAVRYYHDRTYPIDTHCVAQSIITLLNLQDIDPTNVELAHRVYAWARERMWDEKKHYFYYRILRSCTIKTSYMRWTQAWMFLALSQFVTANMPSTEERNKPAMHEVEAR